VKLKEVRFIMNYQSANKILPSYADANNRLKWLDILRGLATVLVVIGHSEIGIFSKYIYWFHMPLFFALSGFLYKALKDNSDIKSFIRRRTHRLLIPYFTYLTFIFLFVQLPILLSHNTDSFNICKNFFIVFLVGGRAIGGLFGVYWFFTCLLVTQLTFAIIHTSIKQKKIQLLVIFFLYFLAHVEANYVKVGDINVPIPWNADVSMFALIFYALGFFAKDFLDLKKSKSIRFSSFSINMRNIGMISIILSVTFVILNHIDIIDYSLNLKYVQYNNLLLDIIIPTIFILSIFYMTQLNLPDSAEAILTSIGNNSLPIIFLHMPIRIAIDIINSLFVHINSGLSLIYIILGIILPFYLNTLIFRKLSFSTLTG
jgi:fucose 4-O-acetylase-like acetyltransferase